MHLTIMLLCVAMLASPVQVLAQENSQERLSPFHHFIVMSCPGKNLEITLKSGGKVSGKCHSPMADRFQITDKGVTHDIHYASIATIRINRRWFSKLKDAVVVPYCFVKMVIGGEELYPF